MVLSQSYFFDSLVVCKLLNFGTRFLILPPSNVATEPESRVGTSTKIGRMPVPSAQALLACSVASQRICRVCRIFSSCGTFTSERLRTSELILQAALDPNIASRPEEEILLANPAESCPTCLLEGKKLKNGSRKKYS